jgi:lipopolysaccharide transport system ATP-binding protein
MTDLAIRIQGLSKEYKLGAKPLKYRTLREAITAPLETLRRRRANAASETFSALRDVTFDVRRGEVVGVIGRNGAGKSTLLKILSRITEPSAGFAEIYGRVTALLEVGTGFHPELTGRENVFLNGAILGMTRAEIVKRFDEIVAFSGVERHIDTTVKHYSSGMQLRLAFAVSAHLDPEILIVDEVLAVGDAEFQRKCVGKMEDVAKQGRTVLFVSHNMAAVASMCERGIVIDQGAVVCDDKIKSAISYYMRGISTEGRVALRDRKTRRGDQRIKFSELRILDNSGQCVNIVSAGDDVTIELEYDVADPAVRNVSFQIAFSDSMGRSLFACLTRIVDQNFAKVPPGSKVRCHIPGLPLTPGAYRISIFCKVDGQTLADEIDGAADVSVESGDFFGTGKIFGPETGFPFLVRYRWEMLEGESLVVGDKAQ